MSRGKHDRGKRETWSYRIRKSLPFASFHVAVFDDGHGGGGWRCCCCSIRTILYCPTFSLRYNCLTPTPLATFHPPTRMNTTAYLIVHEKPKFMDIQGLSTLQLFKTPSITSNGSTRGYNATFIACTISTRSYNYCDCVDSTFIFVANCILFLMFYQ